MKTLTSPNHAVLGIATICLLLATSASAAKLTEVRVTGQDDATVDRPAIQSAIDSAPGVPLVVKLRGVFQLDGMDILVARSDLTIKGDRQGATLKGKLGTDGLPIDDIDNFPNRGFRIASDDALTNIEIRDLALTGLRTPIYLRGTVGEIRNVSIKSNSVENSFYGVYLFGQVSDVKIANNRIIGVTSEAILLRGAPPGQVTNVTIVDNDLADAVLDAVSIFNVSGATIANNFLSTAGVSDFPVPLVAYGVNTDVVVKGNTLQGGLAAGLLYGEANGFTLTQNCIRNGGTQGLAFLRSGGILVGLFGDASGFEIMDNSYEANVAEPPSVPRDIWLSANSTSSMVTEWAGTVVLDDGAANAVVLLSGDGTDYCSG